MGFKKVNSKETPQGKIISEYISKYPEWFPLASLARIITHENPHTFSDSEQARSSIRYYKGQAGDVKRANGSKQLHEDNIKRKSAPFAMPPTWGKEKEIFQIPSALKKAGFIADLQCPFHDPKAIDICFDYIAKQGCDHLIINGDLLDFYGLSFFEKDPKKRDFKHEYDMCLQLLGYIKNAFPNIPIYYSLDANHEFRYERYMLTKAPILLGLSDAFELSELLMLNNFGIIPIKGADHIKFGDLIVLHGHTVFARGSGVSPARTLYLRTKENVIGSHVHRTSEYTDKDFNGKIKTCWTTGHLMHSNVEYCQHLDQYNQGFAILEKDLSGQFEVHNKRIYLNKVR
jgi:hypothetical protein